MGPAQPSERAPSPWAALPGPGVLLAFGCLALAGLSVAVPYQLDGDAWSWIVWGREVRELDLSLPGGSAWKPLPVLFTTVFSLLGDAAPALWLWFVRACWFGCLVLAYRLGARLGGRIAGAIAALGLLLIPSPGAGWLAYFLQGDSEPLIAVAVLGAIESHLAGRRLLAAGLGALAALGRPEAWPLLVVYAGLQWRSHPRDRVALAAMVAIVPALWLGGGLWGGGEPLASAERARRNLDAFREQRGTPTLLTVAVFYGKVVGQIVIAPLWVAAVGAVVAAGRRLRSAGRDTEAGVEVALGVAVAAWIGIDAAGLLIGLPAGSRFLFAPAAVLCVLGGSGIARAVRAGERRGWKVPVAGALALVLVWSAIPRVRELADKNPRDVVVPADIGRALRTVLESTDAAGRVRRCGGEVVMSGATARSREVAWRLGLALREVTAVEGGRPVRIERGIVVARTRRRSAGRTEHGVGGTGRVPAGSRVGRAGRWAVYQVGCGRG